MICKYSKFAVDDDFDSAEAQNSTKRGPRTTRAQHDAYIAYVENNRAVLDSLHRDYGRLCTELTELLNSVPGSGPHRSTSMWQKASY